jgi:predicted PurR-regulated permease PerM
MNVPAATGSSLPRSVLLMLWLAGATVVVAGLHALSDILAPVVLALVLTIAVHPARTWLERHGWPRWLQTVTVILLVYVTLLAFTVALVVAVARFAALLPTYQEEFASWLEEIRQWLLSIGVTQEQIEAMLSAFDLGRLAAVTTSLLSGTLGVVSDLVFIVTLLLFLALDGSWLPERLRAAPSDRHAMVEALIGFAHGTRTYLVVSTVFGLIVAVIDTGLLWLLGIPVPMLWGLLAFLTNYIPNIGFVIGVIPPAVLGFLEGGPGLFLAVIAGYSVINVIIQSVIQPKVMGDAVGLSSSLTFLSLVFWAWVFGALGALLAIPLSLLTKALLVDGDPAAAWLQPYLSGGGAEKDEALAGESHRARSGRGLWVRGRGRSPARAEEPPPAGTQEPPPATSS